MNQFILALAGVLLLPTAGNAGAEALSKIDFEQRSGVIVWDLGSQRGVVDEADDLTDIYQECTILESIKKIDPDAVLASKKTASPKVLKQTVAETLERLGVNAVELKMNPVAAFISDSEEPIFLLFPENHLTHPVERQVGELHLALAHDIFNLTTVLDMQNTPIVNTAEGPQGFWPAEFNLSLKTKKQRVQAGRKLLEKKWITGSQLVNETYGDRILSRYHDDNALTIEYALSFKAYLMTFGARRDPDLRWFEAKSYIESIIPNRTDKVNVDSFRDYFEGISLRSVEDIDAINSQLCEARSREMARYTYELAKQQGARVVYASFGALHAHGFMEQLRRYSASYIVFSPNF